MVLQGLGHSFAQGDPYGWLSQRTMAPLTQVSPVQEMDFGQIRPVAIKGLGGPPIGCITQQQQRRGRMELGLQHPRFSQAKPGAFGA